MLSVRWGIVGFGWVARDFMAPAILAAGHRLVAVCDPRPAACREAELSGARSYTGIDALAEDPEVEAVYVATPNHLHRPMIQVLAERHKAILCEKPMAHRLADAEAIVAACRANRVLYGTAFDQRHHPVHAAMRRHVAEGLIGCVTAIRIVYACWLGPEWTTGTGENWRIDAALAGGGSVIDLAPHGIDLVQFLLGEPLVELAAMLQHRVHSYPVDDGGMLIGRSASGVLASLHVAYNCPDPLPRRRLEVAGTLGLLTALDSMGQDPGGRLSITDGSTGRQRDLAVEGIDRSPFINQVDAFSAAVRGASHDFDADRDLAAMRLLSGALARVTPGTEARHAEPSLVERGRDPMMPARPHHLPERLPEAAHRYIEALPPGRLVGFSMTPLDRTGVPAWKVGLFLDDAAGLPGAMPSGYGYGTTDDEAIVGALAEIAEMICPTLRLRQVPPRLGSYRVLSAEVGRSRIVDPLDLCLPAGSSVDHDTALAWTPAVRARTGEPVLVPLDVAACDTFELPQTYRPFTTLITNGLGAGPDLDWAIGHGLLECLQRDGNGLVFRALDRGIVLDLPADLDAETRLLLDHLERSGLQVIPKFASDEFGLANVYVVGHDHEGHGPRVPIMLSACGEACDPDSQCALRKAVLEFCSARVRKTYGHGPLDEALGVAPDGYVGAFVRTALPSLEGEESRALRAMMDWAGLDAEALRRSLAETVLAERFRKPFGSLPSVACADAYARGRIARARLEAAGFDVLYVDCSPPGHPIGVVKVVVPGLEVETMSYYRIGERNTRKLLERDVGLISSESRMRVGDLSG